MDRVGEIMERLGFNKDAHDGVKAAFVKNLIKQAYGVEVSLPPQYGPSKPQTLEELNPIPLVQGAEKLGAPWGSSQAEPQQLSFNLDYNPKVG